MKNHITHIKPGSQAQNHDRWFVAFREKKDVLVGLIDNTYLINNYEVQDLEVKIGYEKSNSIVFNVLRSILPNKNLVLHVFVHSYSWLGIEQPSFFHTFKEMRLDLLLLLRYLFKIKNKKYESYINSVKFSFHKKAYVELEKQLEKDGLDLLNKDEDGYATINLKNKVKLMPKYLENLGFYSFPHDRDWIFAPKTELKTYKEFKNSVDLPFLYKS